ncbi:interferon-inducible GTPase 1-like protein [Cricetulus griseus]|uniref:Interferon-inducible GTPase 1-like protein n=2 Tax=Cricetulus griseus TaxID=10029 RepID=A0A061IG52_CRIGR|nr:interferon-inducible GTPase 1-like protein [Cricetulus griseus]
MRLDLEKIALESIMPCLHKVGFCYPDNFLGEVVGNCVLERVKQLHYNGALMVASRDLSDYDFQVLMDSLIKDLPAQKRHNFTLSISNITEAAIDRKRESIQQCIWKEVFTSGLLATIPAVGILGEDMKKLKVKTIDIEGY